jgi:hypothetical protein
MVLFIFQLPAMIGFRAGISSRFEGRRRRAGLCLR